jgi:hypothetical protein
LNLKSCIRDIPYRVDVKDYGWSIKVVLETILNINPLVFFIDIAANKNPVEYYMPTHQKAEYEMMNYLWGVRDLQLRTTDE